MDNQKKSVLELSSKDKNPDASWSEFYVLAEHWQSDMMFFQDELQFLSTLIDKYFMRLTEEENISKTKPLTKTLSGMVTHGQHLAHKILEHSKHLQELMQNPFPYDSQIVKDEHAELEKDLNNFVRALRAVKRETFELTEQVLRTEKAKHLLGQ